MPEEFNRIWLAILTQVNLSCRAVQAYRIAKETGSTSTEEFGARGGEFARRIKAAKGPLRVLVPLEGFSDRTKRSAHNLEGKDCGPWKRAEDYRVFADSLKQQVKTARIDELMLHVNDIQFADACVDAFVGIAKR